MLAAPKCSLAVALREAVLWTLAAFVAYAALRQPVFFKTDGPYLVLRLADSDIGHPYNVLYMPLLAAFSVAVRGLDATAFEVAGWFSAAGAALGVGITALAVRRLGLGTRPAWLATLAVAVCPPIVFFATVVEHHGPFLPFAAAVFLAAVELARRPTVLLAVAFAVTGHLAWAMHGTGALLPAPFLAAYVAWRSGSGTFRRDLAIGALAGGLHVAAILLLEGLELPNGGFDAAVREVAEKGIGAPRGIEHVPAVLLQEWIVPFLPLSLTWLAAFRRPPRAEAMALLVGLVPYVWVCERLIVGEPEFGAYLLPLALPAAILTVRALPPALVVAVILVEALLAGRAVLDERDREAYRAFGRDVAALQGQAEPVLLIGGTEEIAWALAAAPDAPRFLPETAAHTAADAGLGAAGLVAVFDHYVSEQQRAGRSVVLSAGARDALTALPGDAGVAGRALLEHVRARYRPRVVRLGAHDAWQLTAP